MKDPTGRDPGKQKNAPDVSSSSVEGENRTNQEGTIMTNSTVFPDLTRADIEKYFTAIDDCPEDHHVIIAEDEPGYFEPRDMWTRPRADLRDTDDELIEDIKKGRPHVFGAWYTPEGKFMPLAERSKEWMETEWASLNWWVNERPNSIQRSQGGFLFISHGVWYTREITTIPGGVPAVTFISVQAAIAELRAQREAERAAFKARHPEIEANKPSWADEIHIDPPDDDQTDEDATVYYNTSVGEVRILQDLTLVDGAFRSSDPVFTVNVEDIDEAAARRLIHDLCLATTRTSGSKTTAYKQEGEKFVEFTGTKAEVA